MSATAAVEQASALSIEQVERHVQNENNRKRKRERRSEVLFPILVSAGLLIEKTKPKTHDPGLLRAAE